MPLTQLRGAAPVPTGRSRGKLPAGCPGSPAASCAGPAARLPRHGRHPPFPSFQRRREAAPGQWQREPARPQVPGWAREEQLQLPFQRRPAWRQQMPTPATLFPLPETYKSVIIVCRLPDLGALHSLHCSKIAVLAVFLTNS